MESGRDKGRERAVGAVSGNEGERRGVIWCESRLVWK